jgi:hypothetical protein
MILIYVVIQGSIGIVFYYYTLVVVVVVVVVVARKTFILVGFRGKYRYAKAAKMTTLATLARPHSALLAL